MLTLPSDPFASGEPEDLDPTVTAVAPSAPEVAVLIEDVRVMSVVPTSTGLLSPRPTRTGPDGFEHADDFPADADTPTLNPEFSSDLAAPVGGPELALADVEIAGNASAMRAFRSFFGGTDAHDSFSFASFADEAASNVTLDPFLDAVDPVWLSDVMATFVADDGVPLFDFIPDSPDLMINPPIDGPDGWVV